MTYPELVFLAGNIAIIGGAITAWAHVLLYAIRTEWERSYVGRHLMVTVLMFAVVLTYTAWRALAVGLIAPLTVGVLWTRLVIFVVVWFVIGGWLVLLVKEQSAAERKRKKDVSNLRS
jgi:type VI protein secretion system component VasK